MDGILYALLAVSVFFHVLGGVALLRFPDLYTRLHGQTKSTTFGSIFTVFAVLAYAISKYLETGMGKYLSMGTHSIVALLALMITNATGAHAIARAARMVGVRPYAAVVDELEGVEE